MQGQCQTGPHLEIIVSYLFTTSCGKSFSDWLAPIPKKAVVLTQHVVDFNHFRKARFWRTFYLLDNLMLKIRISDSASIVALSRYNFNHGRRSNRAPEEGPHPAGSGTRGTCR